MKYRHALCLNPYARESSAAMGFFPPTGLEYVATAMEGQVGKVTLVDLRQARDLQEIEHLNLFIHQQGVDLLCVSVNWSYCYEEVCCLLNQLPQKIPLIVGGQQATDQVEELLQRCPNIDILVRGEGEETIREIAQDRPLAEIQGISYRQGSRIVHNPNRPLPPVDILRYPDRQLRYQPYFIQYQGVRLMRGEFDTVLSARGCPYHCKFCTFTLNPLGQKRQYSARSPESVVEEIKNLKADIIFFADDNFFADPRRSERLCDLIIASGVKKKFICQARLEIYKEPTMLRKAEMAGFKVMLIGVESPHDRILKQMNKGFNSEEVRLAFNTLKKYNFYYHCYFIYGNIGETKEEMLYIAQFAREIGAHSISYQRLQARKFSPLKELIEKTPGYYMTAKGSVYSEDFGRQEMIRIRRTIGRRFYTPAQVFRIGRTMRRINLVSMDDVLFLILRIPAIFRQIVLRKLEKQKKRKARKKRKAQLALELKI